MAAFYLVTFDGQFPNPLHGFRRCTGTYERDFDDAGRKQTIRDILAGQFEHIDRVIAVDPERGTAEDVTEDIATDCANEADGPLDPTVAAFIERHCGWRMVREIENQFGQFGVGA